MNPADANFPMRIWSEAVVNGLFSALWGMKISGRENIPADGPLIVACNHVSIIDPPLMAVAVGAVRRPFGVGKKELFSKPVLGWWLRGTGSFPLDRSGNPLEAMRTALDKLAKGGCLAIYPEGTRVKPGETRAPKAGVSFLSYRAQAPVLPVRVLGTAQWPWVFPLEARIGKPLPPPASEDRETQHAYARDLMERIYSL